MDETQKEAVILTSLVKFGASENVSSGPLSLSLPLPPFTWVPETALWMVRPSPYARGVEGTRGREHCQRCGAAQRRGQGRSHGRGERQGESEEASAAESLGKGGSRKDGAAGD